MYIRQQTGCPLDPLRHLLASWGYESDLRAVAAALWTAREWIASGSGHVLCLWARPHIIGLSIVDALKLGFRQGRRSSGAVRCRVFESTPQFCSSRTMLKVEATRVKLARGP